MDQYAIYLRKSRADLELEALGEGETLSRHRSMLLDLASRHDILPGQISEFKEVVSGESIASRPQIQKLLNDVYQKKFKAVLVVEVERLARGNTKDQGEVADAFQYSGTKIITPSKIYDPSNEFDQEYFEFGLFMSRREYKTIKRRMEAGRIQSVNEGNYVGSIRPYGYDIQRNNKKERILVINEAEAPVVRQIFTWFTDCGRSAGWIAAELTRMHIPTMTGKSEWNRGTVIDILKNSHYIGNVRWNRRKSSKEYDPGSGSLASRKRRLTPDHFIEAKGKHVPIISEDQFSKAQSMFTNQVPVQLNGEIVNPLAGIMFCKDCGKAMIFQAYTGKQNTIPRFTHKDSQICRKKSVAVPVLMHALVDSLSATIDDYSVKIKDEDQSSAQANSALLEAMEADLEKLKKKRSKLFDLFEDGSYTREEFLERKQKINQAVADLEEQIHNQKKIIPIRINYEEKIATIHQIISMVNDGSISAKERNRFLKSFIDRIEYDAEDLGRNKGTKPILDVYLK